MLIIAGCSGGQVVPLKKEKSIVGIPSAIIVDTIIEGKILGRNLSSPAAVAVDKYGMIYLVDAGNNRIISFNQRLIPIADRGGFGGGYGSFNRPSDIVVDNTLTLVVTDNGNQRIVKLDSKLNYIEELNLVDDEDPFMFGDIAGVTVNEYGEIWISDRSNNRLALFNNISKFDKFVGDFGYGGGQLYNPEKIVRSSKSKFAVCDPGNSRVVIYDEYGNHNRDLVSEQFTQPVSVAYSRNGTLWVLDQKISQVVNISESGELLYISGSVIPGDKKNLHNPTDLVFLSDGRLLIVDTGNNRLVVCRVIYEGS